MGGQTAELTGAELHAVTAWRFPPTYGYPVDYSDSISRRCAKDAQRRL